jgi:hypothetical protein
LSALLNKHPKLAPLLMHSVLSIVRFVPQSLEIAAQKTHSLKKKGLREGILSILAPAGRNLLRSLQDNGSIGQFELDSACISWLAKLPSHQQTQVRLPIFVYVLLSMTGTACLFPQCMLLSWCWK